MGCIQLGPVSVARCMLCMLRPAAVPLPCCACVWAMHSRGREHQVARPCVREFAGQQPLPAFPMPFSTRYCLVPLQHWLLCVNPHPAPLPIVARFQELCALGGAWVWHLVGIWLWRVCVQVSRAWWGGGFLCLGLASSRHMVMESLRTGPPAHRVVSGPVVEIGSAHLANNDCNMF